MRAVNSEDGKSTTKERKTCLMLCVAALFPHLSQANVGCPGGGDCLTWMTYAAENRFIDMSTVFHE